MAVAVERARAGGRPRPAVGGRRAAGVLGVGAATAVSPYLWAVNWGGSDVGPATVALDAVQLVPFAVLALLAGRHRPRLSTRWALVALAGLVVGTLAAQRLASAGAQASDADAVLWGPLLLAVALGPIWALDAGWQRAGGGLAALRPRPERPASPELVVGAGSALVLAVAWARLGGAGTAPALENFVVVFASIVVEALPFVLVGGLISALIEVLVPDQVFARLARLPLAVQVPGAVLGGFAFPVCECGSVPVARRLILRGLHPAAALSFMLGSPILNPIVLGSTYVAYQGRGPWTMVAERAGLGLLAAVLAAVLLARAGAADKLLGVGAHAHPAGHAPGGAHHHAGEHGHAHHHHDAGAFCFAPGPAVGRGRLGAVAGHLATDALLMGRFVVAGGALAALLQTLVSQSVFAEISTAPVLGVLVLMVAAFVLSLCSEADAFVAVSFAGFGLPAQLAFLVFGPVLDLKLSLLYGATFGWRFVARIVLLTAPLVLAGALLFGALS